jgi:hypothetical protein
VLLLDVLEVLVAVLSLVFSTGLGVSDLAPSDDCPLAEAVDDAEEVDERESVMYQPLPLNTMPTGWMTLRKAPPHCSHVVNGASVKLCRFSITSLQAVQVYV